MIAEATARASAGPGAGLPRRADLPAPPGEVHLLGAGGAGMRALAVLLADAGFRVTGCDRSPSAEAPEITRRGGGLAVGHDPAHVADATLVVHSSAVPADHPELAAAAEAGVPVMRRSRALGALVNDRRLVGVAGAHGKTTITAMTSLAAAAAGLDPCAVVGGRVSAWGANALAGDGPAVVEADEYDGSFLDLDPSLAVVSSLEPEHLESYDGEAGLRRAYRTFAERAAGRDGVLYCVDDDGARELGRSLDGATGYGLSEDAEIRVLPPTEDEPSPRLATPGRTLRFRLAAPGRHNLQNAAAALGAALRLGARPERIRDALADFRGVGRRLELLADAGGIAVIDDYAHHPTEVRASLAAVRSAYPSRSVLVVFQPHLYTRTERLAAEFADALAGADRAWVLPIYPAREEPIPGVEARLVVEAGDGLELVEREAAVEAALAAAAEASGPVAVVFMGAGDVTELARTAAGEVGADAVGG